MISRDETIHLVIICVLIVFFFRRPPDILYAIHSSSNAHKRLLVYEQPGRNCITIEPRYNRNNPISELYREQYFNRSKLLRDCARARAFMIEIKKVYESDRIARLRRRGVQSRARTHGEEFTG